MTIAEDNFDEVKTIAKNTEGITLESLDGPQLLRDLYPGQSEILSFEPGKIVYKDGSAIVFDENGSVRVFSEFVFWLGGIPDCPVIRKLRCLEILEPDSQDRWGRFSARIDGGTILQRHDFAYSESEAFDLAKESRDEKIKLLFEKIKGLEKRIFYIVDVDGTEHLENIEENS